MISTPRDSQSSTSSRSSSDLSTTPLGAKAIVRGRTDTDGRLEAWVNGVPSGDVPLASGGDFSVMLDANLLGKNVVRLIAVDKRGRTSYAETSFRYSGN